jgi:hypothetical protein
MSLDTKLISLGATICGGDLIYRGKTLGSYRHGSFTPTADGLAMSEIDEAVIVEPAPAPKRVGRPPKAAITPPTPEVEDHMALVLGAE